MSLSWEEIVKRVTIQSNYNAVNAASDGWRKVLQRLYELAQDVQKLSDESASWKGGAADAFRDNLKKNVTDLNKLVDDHQSIPYGLAGCAQHLQEAVNTIQIPTWLISDVERQQQAYHMGTDVPGYSQGSFADEYLKHIGGGFYSNIPGWKDFEGWLNNQAADAQKAYDKLCAGYSTEVYNVPAGTRQDPPGVGGTPDFKPSGPGAPGGAGKVSGLGGVGAPGAGHVPAPSGAGGLPGTGTAGGDGTQWPDPSAGGAGTGLAGGVPGGLSGLGGGPGTGGLGGPTGLGGPGGGGLGAGGLSGLGGAAALAAKGGLPPIGPGVGPPSGMVGAGAGGAGRGAAGRGGAGRAGSGRGGMMGGGHGGHGSGDGDDRMTWLQEDDDVWGAGNDAPPPVIGA